MYIFGEDTPSSPDDIQTIDDLQRLAQEQKMHHTRLKACGEILENNTNIHRELDKARRQKIQRQSVAAPFFNELLEAAFLASVGGEPKSLYTGKYSCAPLTMAFVSNKDLTRKLETEKDCEEITYHAQVASHLAPFLNGIASIICPTENFRQAVTTMNMPKSDLAVELLEQAVGAYVITLPSLRGMFGEHGKHDQALLNHEGLLFIKLYRADIDSELTSKLHVPEKLVLASPGTEHDGVKQFVRDSFKSYLNYAEPEQGLVLEAYLVGRSFTIPTTEPIPVSEILKSKSKQTPEEGKLSTLYKFCLNIIMQAVSQGNATTSANLVLDNRLSSLRKIDDTADNLKQNQRDSKSKRVLSSHRLMLKPDISIFDIREKEAAKIKSTSEVGGRLPHWRAAHMHSYWRGSGKNRYLGLPQLVQGCFVDGSKARAKEERKKRRIFWAKLNQM